MNPIAMREKIKDQSGVILVTTLMLMTVLGTLSMAMFARSRVFNNSMEQARNQIIAKQMAQSAVALAVAQLKTTPGYGGTAQYTDFSSSSITGGYEITVTEPETDFREIEVNGYGADGVDFTESVKAYVEFIDAPETEIGARIIGTISMTGSAKILSYDSTSTTSPTTNLSTTFNIYALSDSSDESADDVVSLGSSSNQIGGDVIVYDSGEVSVASGASVDGTISVINLEQGEGNYSEPDSTPGGVTDNGYLNVSDTETTLGTGSYYYDYIILQGTSNIKVTGPVTLYVGGKISLSDTSTINGDSSGKDPSQLVIIQTDDILSKDEADRPWTIEDSAKIYAKIQSAFYSDITISGSGAIYGSVEAASLTLEDSATLWYDINIPTNLSYSQVQQRSYVNDATLA